MSVTDLQDAFATIAEGHKHDDIIDALCWLLGQTIADAAESRVAAAERAHEIGEELASDMVDNWHLVVERRARG